MADAPIPPLPPARLATPCAPEDLDFEVTTELDALEGPPGQARALEALEFGLAMRRSGYNLFVLGPTGSGRHSLVLQAVEQLASEAEPGQDMVYVQNFEDARRPRALLLPAGRGRELARDLQELIEDLRAAIPAAFEGEEFAGQVKEIEGELERHQAEALEAVQEAASKRELALLRTPVGFLLAPRRGDEIVGPKELAELPEAERRALTERIEEMQEALHDAIGSFPASRQEARERLKALHEEVVIREVGQVLVSLVDRWADVPDVVTFIHSLQDDIVKNADAFRQAGEEGGGVEGPPGSPAGLLGRYAVNVLVDRTGDRAAPAVYEDSPTLANLVGRVEHVQHQGTLLTDFTLIKAGALHRAAGGYLILDARRVLTEPMAWDGLKRVLSAGQIRIQSLSDRLNLISTVSLEPEPIPVDVKVVLVGEPMLYYLLGAHEPDFERHFKVAADFEPIIDRDSVHTRLYARMVATQAHERGLLPFARPAVARVIEDAARRAGDASKLATDLQAIMNLIEEADARARHRDPAAIRVDAAAVDAAIAARVRRVSRPRDHLYEAIQRGILRIDTDGVAVGQINGLAVLQLGEYAFGRPSRITATARLGRGELVDIERESTLGGALHSKGVMILSAFLANRYARERPLSLAASLVFEQSYGHIEGDSASLAELCALLSAIADVPILQSLAVTGSIDQLGRVQAIGGVNEKIEGFFDICRGAGPLTGRQGVLIPVTNVAHLMLHRDVVEAAHAGDFAVYAVETVDQALALLTGVEAGQRDAESGEFPPDTVNRRVDDRLKALFETRMSLAKEGEGEPRS